MLIFYSINKIFFTLFKIWGFAFMRTHYFLLMTIVGLASIMQSCARNGNDVWEDTKSAGRHMQRGIRALGGKHGDSRQIRSKSDFECFNDEEIYEGAGFQDYDYRNNSYPSSEFIPLEDVAYDGIGRNDWMIAPPPRETPGEPGSSIPSIEYFKDPSLIPQLAGIFKNIYFDYNSSLIKGQKNLQIIHAIADYMHKNPQAYLFIEGHTDERGPQAYNLALGSQRASAIRNFLINERINPDHLFTISYGKERPIALEHQEEAWSRNRRVEFKVYEY